MFIRGLGREEGSANMVQYDTDKRIKYIVKMFNVVLYNHVVSLRNIVEDKLRANYYICSVKK